MQYYTSVLWMAILIASSLNVVFCGEYDDYRLPTTIVPEKYTLQIFTDLNDSFVFYGNVQIKLKCIGRSQNITLNSAGLAIDEPNVQLHAINCGNETCQAPIVIKKHTYDIEKEHYRIDFDETLLTEREYNLTIPFRGNLTEKLSGYYRSKYIDETGKQKWLAVTQFEPNEARRAFPCFDEPAFKAVFSIALGHASDLTSLSNMPLNTTITLKDDTTMDYYEDSVKMSTYLVAFVVSDYSYKDGIVDPKAKPTNVQFKIWAPTNAIAGTEFAARIGPKYLAYFGEFFNIKYPLPKLDMISIPDMTVLGMENWGLITYQESVLLHDRNVSNWAEIAFTIAHELAHQWFGNLVTMKWWSDIWLNEGFATYMAEKAMNEINSEFNTTDANIIINMLQVLELDSMKSSHPISINITHPREISEIFDLISYKKGSIILRMMDLFLGEDVFRQGLTNYLKKYAYANAETNDLWNVLNDEAHVQNVLDSKMTVKGIMDTWTLQAGYPIISVVRDYKDNFANVSQQRFYRRFVVGNEKIENSCWFVPLTYTTAIDVNFKDTKPKTWLVCDENGSPKPTNITGLPGNSVWVIFNIQSSGLYRVNYDSRNWELLTKTMLEKSETIPVVNRVQLIDDSLELAASGNLDYSIALKLLTYLVSETEDLPWRAALLIFDRMDKRLHRKSAYGLWKKYVKKIITPMYEKISASSEKPANEPILNIACRLEIGDCQKEFTELFKKWMKVPNPDGFNPIPNHLRSPVYCNALRKGDQLEWDFLWNRYVTSNHGADKKTILLSLGCSQEIWLLNRYLQWSLSASSGIRTSEIPFVYFSVASHDIGYYVAKDFLKENLSNIIKRMDRNRSATKTKLRYFHNKININKAVEVLMTTLADQMVTVPELNEFKDFIRANEKNLLNYKQGAAKALEIVEQNVDWIQKHYIEIEAVLQKLT